MPYCAPCARHFIDETALHQHFSSNKHKKLLRPNPVVFSDSARPNEPNIGSSRNRRAIDTINPQTGAKIQGDKSSTYCGECQQRFHTETAFNRHRSSWIHTPKSYCRDCERLFPNQNKLDEHMESGHIPQFHCFDCNKQFPTQQTLNQHQKLPAHASLFCIHCGVHYPAQIQLESHIKSHYSTPCSKCEERFLDLTALARHENFIHPRLELPREGPSDWLSLLHHGDIPRFPCYMCNPSCGRVFDTQVALETHFQFMTERLQLSIVRNNKNTWSILPETPASIAKLRAMTHSKNLLIKNLYVIELPTDEYINGQRKCIHCRG